MFSRDELVRFFESLTLGDRVRVQHSDGTYTIYREGHEDGCFEIYIDNHQCSEIYQIADEHEVINILSAMRIVSGRSPLVFKACFGKNGEELPIFSKAYSEDGDLTTLDRLEDVPQHRTPPNLAKEMEEFAGMIYVVE